MRSRVLVILVMCASLVACQGSNPVGSIITPTPTAVPTAIPSGNSFSWDLSIPNFGSTLSLGDKIYISGTYSRADSSLWLGFAVVREDGETYIDTISGGPGFNSGPCGSGWGLSPLNGLYDFSKGHTIDLLFVIGDEGMMQSYSDNLHSEHVVFQKRIPTQYRVR